MPRLKGRHSGGPMEALRRRRHTEETTATPEDIAARRAFEEERTRRLIERGIRLPPALKAWAIKVGLFPRKEK